MAEEGSAKSVLLRELQRLQIFNEPRGRENPDEFGTDFYQGMTTVFFNKEGDVRLVKGAVEMKKAIDEGFIFTRDDADKFPAPRIKIEEGKIFKKRRKNKKLFKPKNQTPWQEIFRNTVGQLDDGACINSRGKYLDVSHTKGLPRDSH